MQAETLLAEVRRIKQTGEPIPPALFAQINKFLKDNGVDRAAPAMDKIDTLADEVPDFDNVINGDF